MMSKALATGLGLLVMTGCANMGADYHPILDGDAAPTYQQDLQSCQDLARGQSYHEDTVGAVIAGAAFGGLAGDHEDDDAAVEMAVAGAVFGWIGAVFDQAERRESIIVACMKGRGHRVVG